MQTVAWEGPSSVQAVKAGREGRKGGEGGEEGGREDLCTYSTI